MVLVHFEGMRFSSLNNGYSKELTVTLNKVISIGFEGLLMPLCPVPGQVKIIFERCIYYPRSIKWVPIYCLQPYKCYCSNILLEVTWHWAKMKVLLRGLCKIPV